MAPNLMDSSNPAPRLAQIQRTASTLAGLEKADKGKTLALSWVLGINGI
jgi:hypothetical protein